MLQDSGIQTEMRLQAASLIYLRWLIPSGSDVQGIHKTQHLVSTLLAT